MAAATGNAAAASEVGKDLKGLELRRRVMECAIVVMHILRQLPTRHLSYDHAMDRQIDMEWMHARAIAASASTTSLMQLIRNSLTPENTT